MFVDEREESLPTYYPEFSVVFCLFVNGEVEAGAICDGGGGANTGHAAGADAAL